MNYDCLLQKLYSLKGTGLNLDALLTELGDPQTRFRTIRIAGTNGKGSVCAFLSQILQEAGIRVGLFTSPHLVHPEERMQINGCPISSEDFQDTFKRVWAAIENRYGSVSGQYARFFEVVLLMALDYFHRQQVEWAVIECGVGARQDATRIVMPTVSILTNVELDHRESLGETIAQIAYHKAAVVGQDGILITAEEKPEALAAIRHECDLKRAMLIELDVSGLKAKSSTWDGQSFDWHNWHDVTISLLGAHQRKNAVLALEASLALQEEYVDESAIRAGLNNARWPGRMELLQKKPYVMLDGAKNVAGLRALREALEQFRYDRCILVLGIADHKDIEAMVREIAVMADEIISTRASWRGVEPGLLARAADACGRQCHTVAGVDDAMKMAMNQASERDLICVAGSLFLVGEVRTLWRK